MVERQAPLDVAVLCECVDGLVGAVVGEERWHVALQTSMQSCSCSSTGGSWENDVHAGVLRKSMNAILPANWQGDFTSHGPSQSSCNSKQGPCMWWKPQGSSERCLLGVHLHHYSVTIASAQTSPWPARLEP